MTGRRGGGLLPLLRVGAASAAGRAEAAAATLGVVDLRLGCERGPLDTLHEELRHPVPGRDAEARQALAEAARIDPFSSDIALFSRLTRDDEVVP